MARRYEVVARTIACVLAGALIAAAGAAASPGLAAAGPTVAVAVFYAPTPTPTYPGVDPEQYGAAALSRTLAASDGGVTVVPRKRVIAEEAALRFYPSDTLRFARLAALARALGAGRLVVGQIRSWAIDSMGGGGGKDIELGGGGGMLTGLAVVDYQVFDASQGRIVYETQVQGNAVGTLTSTTARATLDDADSRGAAQLAGALTTGAGAP
jgi:hypothetical protein